MGRLIDTDVLVKTIDKHTNDDNQLDNDITCILEEVPTAYDVEKVMDQIYDELYCYNLPSGPVEDIIRKGGVE